MLGGALLVCTRYRRRKKRPGLVYETRPGCDGMAES